MENSVLLNKPDGVGLMDYFKSLDVFLKRKLINELSEVKEDIDNSIKSAMPYFSVVVMASVLGVMMGPSIGAFVFFGSISSIFGFMMLKKLKTALNFKFVIDNMTKNM